MEIFKYTLKHPLKAMVTVKTYKLEKSLNIVLRGILYALIFSSFTGLMAQVRIYLPFTPVPFTGQVFAVLLSGLILGRVFGPLSQIFYITLGLSGINWFAVGPFSLTGGYIVGFVVASFLIGSITENIEKLTLPRTLLAMVTGLGAIYLLGLIQFCLYTGSSISQGIKLAVLPFIPFDLLKALLAAGGGNLIFRRQTRSVQN